MPKSTLDTLSFICPTLCQVARQHACCSHIWSVWLSGQMKRSWPTKACESPMLTFRLMSHLDDSSSEFLRRAKMTVLAKLARLNRMLLSWPPITKFNRIRRVGVMPEFPMSGITLPFGSLQTRVNQGVGRGRPLSCDSEKLTRDCPLGYWFLISAISLAGKSPEIEPHDHSRSHAHHPANSKTVYHRKSCIVDVH